MHSRVRLFRVATNLGVVGEATFSFLTVQFHRQHKYQLGLLNWVPRWLVNELSCIKKTVKNRSFILRLTSTGAKERLALGKKANLYSMISMWLYFTDRHQCLVILMHLAFILWDLFKEVYAWLRALGNDNILKIGKHKRKQKKTCFICKKTCYPFSISKFYTCTSSLKPFSNSALTRISFCIHPSGKVLAQTPSPTSSF